MSTEKIIKKQAKDLLRGNWSTVICAILVVVAAVLAIQTLLTAFLCFAGAVDFETGAYNEEKQYVISAGSLAASLLLIFVSPLANGVVKMICNISLYGKADIFDLFYYFRDSALYFKTVFIDFVLYFLFSIISSLVNVYGYAVLFTDSYLDSRFSFDAESFALLAAYIVTVVMLSVVYMLFVHYPLIAYAYDDRQKASKYMFGFIGFSFKHFAKTFKLVLSLLGWIVLSAVFIIPLFYAAPYIAQSGAVSAKWLFRLEENRGVL